jgi:hypothetical protein
VPYLPAAQGIIEDCLFVFAVAHTYYVSAISKHKLQFFQYVRKDIAENADRLLIERLLTLAAKVRFLDDQSGILRTYDRKLRTIGKFTVGGKDASDELSIRLALNKVIHHRQISVTTEDRGVFVGRSHKETGDLKIPLGQHTESHVVVKTEGEYRNEHWVLGLDLFVLLNEILRVVYFQQSNLPPDEDARQEQPRAD